MFNVNVITVSLSVTLLDLSQSHIPEFHRSTGEHKDLIVGECKSSVRFVCSDSEDDALTTGGGAYGAVVTSSMTLKQKPAICF